MKNKHSPYGFDNPAELDLPFIDPPSHRAANADRRQLLTSISKILFSCTFLCLTGTLPAQDVISSSTSRYDIGTSGGATNAQTAIKSNTFSHSRDWSDISGDHIAIAGSDLGSGVNSGNVAVIGPAPGTANGYAYVNIDSTTGTLKAKTSAYSYGNPLYWEGSDGYINSFSKYQSWGGASATASTKRYFEATAGSGFQVSLSSHYDGIMKSGIGAISEFSSISVVTLVKDPDRYFEDPDLSKALTWWGMKDLFNFEKPYDFVFGEGQQVAQMIGYNQIEESRDTRDSVFDISLNTGTSSDFTLSEGDLIVVDDLIFVQTYLFNPLNDIRSEDPELLTVEADFSSTVTSDLIIQAGSGGFLTPKDQFVVVPEPLSFALFLGAGAVLLILGKRQRSL